MILSNKYKGIIENSEFTLQRNYFLNNFVINGILKEDNFFEINYKFQKPMDTLSKIVFALSSLFLLYLFIIKIWFLFFLFSLILILILSFLKIKSIKELKIFMNDFIIFSKY